MGEHNRAQWRGIMPIEPEAIFTRYEPPDSGIYAEGAGSVDNGVVIVYTVPDGKTLYLTSVDFSCRGSVNGYGSLYIRSDADVYVSTIFSVNVLANTGFAVSSAYPIAKQIPEKYDIVVVSNVVDVHSFGHIVGYTKPV